MSAATTENRISRREADEPAIDWRERAQDAWNDPAWREAAADYHRKRGEGPLVETNSQRLAHLRRLLDDSVSLERCWAGLNQRRRDGAPQSTVEALVYELRTHGLPALERPTCRRRLAEVSADQLRELMASLIGVRAGCPAVTDELLIALDRIRRP